VEENIDVKIKYCNSAAENMEYAPVLLQKAALILFGALVLFKFVLSTGTRMTRV
jgi:hypothetical protein